MTVNCHESFVVVYGNVTVKSVFTFDGSAVCPLMNGVVCLVHVERLLLQPDANLWTTLLCFYVRIYLISCLFRCHKSTLTGAKMFYFVIVLFLYFVQNTSCDTFHNLPTYCIEWKLYYISSH